MTQSILAFSEATSPAIFNFGNHSVRIIMRDGQPWFVAFDVCQALGYANSRKAVADHLDDDERSTVTNSDSRNGGGKLTIISESGLYALVLRSRKPEARKFAKWVTSEVLPSIRQTGSYGQPNHERLHLAYQLASQAAAQVSQAVFDAVMTADADWQYSRYMLKLDDDGNGGFNAKARQIERNACVLPLERFHSAIEDSICVDAQTLTQLVSVCTARLGRMAARNAVAAPQQGSLQLR